MLQFNVSLVWNIINLIVLCLLLKHFLIKPVLGIMDRRQAMINEGLENAKSTREEADALKSQYESALKDARAESGRIVEDARDRAKKEYDRIVAEADEKASENLAKARETLEAERKKAMEELRGSIAQVALCAARKVSGSQETASEDLSVYDRFIQEAGEENEQESR